MGHLPVGFVLNTSAGRRPGWILIRILISVFMQRSTTFTLSSFPIQYLQSSPCPWGWTQTPWEGISFRSLVSEIKLFYLRLQSSWPCWVELYNRLVRASPSGPNLWSPIVWFNTCIPAASIHPSISTNQANSPLKTLRNPTALNRNNWLIDCQWEKALMICSGTLGEHSSAHLMSKETSMKHK